MKKFLYFAATVLGLSVIFGSGWAAGTGRINSVAPATKIDSPERQVVEEEPSNDKLPEEPRELPCPKKDGKCGENERGENADGEKEGKFKFKIPSPADFRDRFTRLPHFN